MERGVATAYIGLTSVCYGTFAKFSSQMIICRARQLSADTVTVERQEQLHGSWWCCRCHKVHARSTARLQLLHTPCACTIPGFSSKHKVFCCPWICGIQAKAFPLLSINISNFPLIIRLCTKTGTQLLKKHFFFKRPIILFIVLRKTELSLTF